ncbi:hypothetical protein NLI96_g12535 [Meripilus lineatus]|uniref:Uncharacterized protein n=1 Tax=Meripilus lineatus TaxID=2056292 RepID=A0AAD5Y7H3_9APHY|nr:hypothetical protein NLI96_g12535 [Physisporinus lineatus]
MQSSPHLPQLSSLSNHQQLNVVRDQTQNKAEDASIPPCYYNWIYKLLIRLPHLLDNLSILAFVSFPTLHPQFIRLVSCFKTVKALGLWDSSGQSFSEIIQLINRLPQLIFLYIEGMKWDRPARFFPSQQLRLEQLTCSLTSNRMRADVLDWLGSLQHLSGLRCLEILSLESHDMSKVHHILNRYTHSLRFLDLASRTADIFESLSLSSLSQLECLGIRISPSPFRNHSALFSSCISQLLTPSLVYVNIGYFENLDPESFAVSQSDWKNVDDVLSDSKFNRLTYFVMNLHSEDEGIPVRNTLRATFKTIFPKSYKRRILWVAKSGGNSEHRAFHICEEDEHDFNMDELANSYSRM